MVRQAVEDSAQAEPLPELGQYEEIPVVALEWRSLLQVWESGVMKWVWQVGETWHQED